jgi:NADP-dependent aldehyde dehydrogenase
MSSGTNQAGSDAGSPDEAIPNVIHGIDPRTGAPFGAGVAESSAAEVAAACGAAAQAAWVLGDPAEFGPARRAGLLRAVAEVLDAHGAELVALADRETALGSPRLPGELARTTGQLRLLAEWVESGGVPELEADAEPADAGALPTPRPALYRTALPIGPVAVFAAGNFPFAFSVAGGDTASALAAGCPVVVKAHPGHPETSRRTAELVAGALVGAGAPEGSFAVVHGMAAGVELIRDARIKAGAFTGSLRGGRALFELAASGRAEPIPFYGELGSVNPVYATPAAAYVRGPELAAGFVGSFTLGAGQFCTKPGLLFLPEDHGLEAELRKAVEAVPAAAMLTGAMRDGYAAGTTATAGTAGVRVVARGGAAGGDGHAAQAVLFATSARNLAERPELAEEVFGPCSLVVEYADTEELCAAVAAAPGSLTATVHADAAGDVLLARRLVALAAGRAGRVLWNGWPTGVAVARVQQHGGRWPASTSPRDTSVGAASVGRFLVPVVFQDVPAEVRER